MAEAHDARLVGERLADPALRLGGILDLLHHEHDLLVGPAVERPFERADARHYRGMNVAEGGGGDAGGEGRGVELVIGVEDEGHVEGLGGERSGLLAAHHVEEIAGEDRRGLGPTGGLPRRMRSHAATSVGICAVRRMVFRRRGFP